MCEIDSVVVDVAKKYFGTTTATAFNDPRVTLVHADAAEYVKNIYDEFDVVIVDSSDPVGPAETLFTAGFYKALRGAMRSSGAIMCNQGECMWLHLDLIGDVLKHCTQVFPSVDYAFTTIPTCRLLATSPAASARTPTHCASVCAGGRSHAQTLPTRVLACARACSPQLPLWSDWLPPLLHHAQPRAA